MLPIQGMSVERDISCLFIFMICYDQLYNKYKYLGPSKKLMRGINIVCIQCIEF